MHFNVLKFKQEKSYFEYYPNCYEISTICNNDNATGNDQPSNIQTEHVMNPECQSFDPGMYIVKE